MMQKTWTLLILIFLSSIFPAYGMKLNSGPWRFELKTTHAVIPFIMDLKWKNGRMSGTLHNGKEKIPLKDIVVKAKKISIPLLTYELSIELTQEKPSLLVGYLVRHNKNPEVKTSLVGIHGEANRFPGEKEKPSINLEGRWDLTLTDGEEKATPAIGKFTQKGNILTGTILTPTGDYRYLEGVVSGTSFAAASFDGVYNYLFSGTIIKNELDGTIKSNTLTKVKGTLNDKVELPDAYKQTSIKEIKFSFPNLKGEMVSLTDVKYKNKPVVIQIFGSWCPNCMDELNFLSPWYKEHSSQGVEILALAFERSLGKTEALAQLYKLQNKLKVSYPILHVGSTSEDKPAAFLPGLENFISFPTTIFLNKKHAVEKVHAGFSGPSTGEYYEKWIKEFNQTVTELINAP